MSLLIATVIIPMVAEDFRSRQIRILWLVLFGGGTLSIAFSQAPASDVLRTTFYNILFLLYLSAGMVAWIWVKNRKRHNANASPLSLKSSMGMGDALFVLATTPLFPLDYFVWFLISAMVISLAWWSGWRVAKKRNPTIPFVGICGPIFYAFLIYHIL